MRTGSFVRPGSWPHAGPADHSFSELKRDADQRLVDFLKVELNLGSTFVDLAKQHRTEEDRAKSLENARKAVETIRRFQGRIVDHVEWTQIHNEANELEKLLSLQPKR